MATVRLIWWTALVFVLCAEGAGNFSGTMAGAAQATPDYNPPPAPPIITSFTAVRGNGNVWSLEGTIESGCESVMIRFSNLPSVQGLTTNVNPDGSFWMTVEIADGDEGLVGAQAVDALNQTSDIEYTPIYPS